MPQTLYRFGINAFSPTTTATTTTTIPTPTLILTTPQILILWTSWCDVIYTTTHRDNTRSITYSGTSLNATQQREFTFPSSDINKALANPGCQLSFFGSAMHDGVRGYICDGVICVFGTPAEEAELGSRDCDVEVLTTPLPLAEVRLCSDMSLLLAFRDHEGAGRISTVKDIQGLKDYCNSDAAIERLASFSPTQLVVNATTATALSSDGQVYTRTADPRYPACLGRPHTGTTTFEPVPYLSETRIRKIASGGYMTAAISEDGELFLWGQSNPGTESELEVLHRLDWNLGPGSKDTVIRGDTEQDEYVKCLNIYIDGQIATAYDVAIGFGHVLVAAKNDDSKHVVYAAGCGSEGQLSLGGAVGFTVAFEEVGALRDKRVIQLAAAGWSSFVVTEE